MRYSVTLLMLVCIIPFLDAQELKTSGYKQTEPEIGVFEKLGDTIPLDLWFLNEESEKVTLRQLINKPTVMCFVYFDCPNLCSPLMDGVADVVSKMDMQLGVEPEEYDRWLAELKTASLIPEPQGLVLLRNTGCLAYQEMLKKAL